MSDLYSKTVLQLSFLRDQAYSYGLGHLTCLFKILFMYALMPCIYFFTHFVAICVIYRFILLVHGVLYVQPWTKSSNAGNYVELEK